jgi:recombinational DNA repair ATPase RecF
MKLKHVTIHNYRSIKHLDLKFDPKCRILVGINESGKTNILHALNLLDPKAATTRRDLREPGLHEARIAEAYVRFVFTPPVETVVRLVEHLKTTILSLTYGDPIIRIAGAELTLG